MSKIRSRKTIQKLSEVRSNYKPWLVVGVLLFSDLLAITLSFGLAFLLRTAWVPVLGGVVRWDIVYQLLIMQYVVIIGLFTVRKMYPGIGRTGVVEVKEIIETITIALVIIGLAVFILGYGSQFSRWIFLLSGLFTYVFVNLFRLAVHNRGSLFSWWAKPVVVVGMKGEIAVVISQLRQARRMAFRPMAAMFLDGKGLACDIDGVPAFPYRQEIQEIIRAKGIHQAFFVGQGLDLDPAQAKQLYQLSLSFEGMIYVMGKSALSSLSVRVIDLDGRPALQVNYNLLNPLAMRIKRVIDLLFCLLTMAITFPLLLVIALIIRIDTPGPVIYVQKRIGKDGRIFDAFKFRTMQDKAQEKLEELLRNDAVLREEYETYHKLQNDPRITRVGRLLRKFSLDELPQMINVARGEMSLVGPRAYLPSEKELMGEHCEIIQRVAPGLTGWWQVMGRHEVSFEERMRLDEYYISNFSLWMDLYIVIKTVWVIIKGAGV